MQIGPGICICYEHALVTLTQVTLFLAMKNIKDFILRGKVRAVISSISLQQPSQSQANQRPKLRQCGWGRKDEID